MDLIGEIFALGIDAIVFGVCCNMYIKNRRAVDAVQNVQQIEINSKLESMLKSQPDHKLPYVAVRGSVHALGPPIKSQNSPDVTGVIQRLSLKEHTIARSSAGFWSERERTLSESHNVVPFAIKQHNVSIKVEDPLSADILDLTSTGTHLDSLTPSSLSHILSFFFIAVKQYAVIQMEKMLVQGSFVTGIGELRLSEDGIILCLPSDGSPFCITELRVAALANQLLKKKEFSKILLGMSGAMAIFLIGAAFDGWWRYKRQDDRDY